MSAAGHVVDLCSSDSEGSSARGRRRSRNSRPMRRKNNVLQQEAVQFLEVVQVDDEDDKKDRRQREVAVERHSMTSPTKRRRLRQDHIDLTFPTTQHSSSTQKRRLGPNVAATAAARVFRSPSSTPAAVAIQMIQPPSMTPKERVLEVFPDVSNEHLEKLLRDCNNSFEMVLSILSDGSYPKSKSDAGKTPPFRNATIVPSSVLVTRNHAKPMYDYSSASSFQPTPTYINEAVEMLLFEFPFVRVDNMRKFLKDHKQHFTLVRNHILAILKNSLNSQKDTKANDDDVELQQFHSLKPVWVTKRPSQEQIQSLGARYCTKRFVRRPLPTLTDPILRDEVQFAREELETWMEMMDEKQKRCEARKRSKQSGNGVECGCCFDKVPIEEMVGCRNEGHLFCMDCIQGYADTQIFSNGSLGVIKATGVQACELVCFDSSGCQSGFFEDQLQRALPVKTLERYTELQFRASIEAAGMSEEICSCPKCGFQAYLPLNLVVFQCPMDDCRHESCRKCGKEPHIPLRCEEVVQKNREDEGRLKVEEALAEAKIRKCPKCTTPFVKSDGCNKMTCRCGAKICYICRQELNGHNPYDHFCKIPHCDHKKCGKCVLFSNAEEDDQRAMREAGLTAAQAYRQELQETGGSDVHVDIDVDRIMTSGEASRRRPVSIRR